ncbi:XrtA/PEP-CTERM system-associated ATPase [Oleidesulfovibrio sp.]|uniref:XrtA/PEP-CTERM system-associated ATPase n=1 Tax=Oleidesulfovibrio sp. TaxID=2909707 RepID=UPI003A83A003
MYTEFFQLRAKPFELLPNPDFLYPSKAHRKALAYFEYGLKERSGFILLTGEVGSGKTTLIREMLKRDLSRMVLSKVFNTRVDSTQLVAMINDDFGLETEGLDKTAMLRDLNDFLIDQYAAGRRAVLIIDEAQNLTPELLEEVRMLSNLETDNAKLLQIILVGQPELREILRSPALVQLRQRIQVHCHISPLSIEETEEYVLYRLERAGNRDAMSWDDGVFEIMHQATHGVPRLLNILCDYAFLDAYAEERRYMSKEQLRDMLDEMDFERQFWPESDPARDVQTGDRVHKNMQPLRTVSKAGGTSAAKRMMTLLQDIGQRVDILERAHEKGGPETIADIAERLTMLEKRMTMLSARFDSVQVGSMHGVRAPELPMLQESKPPRKSWLRKLFYGD